MIEEMPSPHEFGAPRKFSAWRKHQADALREALESSKRFTVLALPTGVGKSLVYFCYSLFDARKTVVLTSTRGLQDQIVSEFGQISDDVRGMSNYDCLEIAKGGPSASRDPSACDRRYVSCAQGPCLAGVACAKKAGGCLYYDAVRRAAASNRATTNYAFWLTDGEREEGPRVTASVLVCDEAHLIGEELARHMTAVVLKADLASVGLKVEDVAGLSLESWAKFAKHGVAEIAKHIERGGMDVTDTILAKKLKKKLERVASARAGEWVMERDVGGAGWSFAPIWPERYAAEVWRDAEKVLLVSATIRPKALHMLGLKEEDYDFLEYPSPLPMHRRPIVSVHGPTTRISHKSDGQTLDAWIEKIDSIIDGRLDRKGIIHTVSYARATDIFQRSRHHASMILNTSRTTREAVASFKNMKPPAVLVSPSVATGYDFPYDAAEYQIIAKVPFPDSRGAWQAARQEQDREQPYFMAITDLVQSAGRIVRAEDDAGETLIVDNNADWLLWKYRQFVPRWFSQAFSKKARVPAPRKKL